MLDRIARKVAAALSAPPGRAHLSPFLIELAWLVPLLTVLGMAGGLLNWAPALNAATLKLALLAIVFPSLGEELLFRVALLPAPDGEKPIPWRMAAISTVLFVLWHPVQAPLFGPRWSELVLNPWFLLSAGALGVACVRLYWKTASIWPPVLLPWTIVVFWKAFRRALALDELTAGARAAPGAGITSRSAAWRGHSVIHHRHSRRTRDYC